MFNKYFIVSSRQQQARVYITFPSSHKNPENNHVIVEYVSLRK